MGKFWWENSDLDGKDPQRDWGEKIYTLMMEKSHTNGGERPHRGGRYRPHSNGRDKPHRGGRENHYRGGVHEWSQHALYGNKSYSSTTFN